MRVLRAVPAAARCPPPQVTEVPATIPTLWPTVQQWLAQNPQLLAPNNLLPAFLEGGLPGADGTREDQQYTGCHMWSK